MYILATSENMVGDNFENLLPEVTNMHLKSSTMVGENLKNYLYGMAKKDLNSTIRDCSEKDSFSLTFKTVWTQD